MTEGEVEVLAAPPGAVLGGRYRVVRRLDSGGMGVVYAAEDVRNGRALALKILKPQHAGDPDVRARFHREHEILSQLDHPAVVRSFGAGTFPGGHLYLDMELLQGRTLKD